MESIFPLKLIAKFKYHNPKAFLANVLSKPLRTQQIINDLQTQLYTIHFVPNTRNSQGFPSTVRLPAQFEPIGAW